MKQSHIAHKTAHQTDMPALTDEKTPQLSLAELQAQLHTSSEGLSKPDAQERLAKYGFNELSQKIVRPWQQLLTHFSGPIPWMIEIAALLSALVRDWTDLSIILVLLVANALVGFWEEYQAGNAIAALKAQLALQAKAKRDNMWTTLPARELVPGDVIRLRIGDVVPADARLIGDSTIEID